MADPSESQQLDARVTQLESLLTHVDHVVSQLDEVIQVQAQQHDRLLKRIELLQHRLDQLDEGRDERSLEDEKPPHY